MPRTQVIHLFSGRGLCSELLNALILFYVIIYKYLCVSWLTPWGLDSFLSPFPALRFGEVLPVKVLLRIWFLRIRPEQINILILRLPFFSVCYITIKYYLHQNIEHYEVTQPPIFLFLYFLSLHHKINFV